MRDWRILRGLEPGPIHALVDDLRAIDWCAERHATVAHEGAEVDRPIRRRQQSSDGAVVVGIVSAAVVDVSVHQDVGTAQAGDERSARRGPGKHPAEAAWPSKVTMDEVDLLLFDDLGSEPLDRQRAVELARVPGVGQRDCRSALERKRGCLRVVHQRLGWRQCPDFDRTVVRVSCRLRREHVGLHAGCGQGMDLFVEESVGGELPGPFGLRNEIEDSHPVGLR